MFPFKLILRRELKFRAKLFSISLIQLFCRCILETLEHVEYKLKQCFYNFLFHQNLNNTFNEMNLKMITKISTVNSTVNSTDVKVIKAVNQLDYTLTQLRESTSKHQYFIYFVLFLLTAIVIYGYLFIYRRFYHISPIIRYNNSESSIQLLS